MKLIDTLAYYRSAPWAQYLAGQVTEHELYTEVSRLTTEQICHYADSVAAHNIQRSMTPYKLKHLLVMACKAFQ